MNENFEEGEAMISIDAPKLSAFLKTQKINLTDLSYKLGFNIAYLSTSCLRGRMSRERYYKLTNALGVSSDTFKSYEDIPYRRRKKTHRRKRTTSNYVDTQTEPRKNTETCKKVNFDAEKLCKEIKKCNQTYRSLEIEFNYPRGTISHACIEGTMSIESLNEIAVFLGTSAGTFITDEPEPFRISERVQEEQIDSSISDIQLKINDLLNLKNAIDNFLQREIESLKNKVKEKSNETTL